MKQKKNNKYLENIFSQAKFTYTSPITGKKTKGLVDEVLSSKVRIKPEDKYVEELYMRSSEGVLYPINHNLEIYD